MDKFKHYILTRFNLLDAKTDIYNYGVKNPQKWMWQRIVIFEKYCLPSVMKQTCQDFVWLLAFSKKTDPLILKRYRNLKNIQIISEYPADWARNNFKGGWLITSRLDKDDILEPNYIEEVQKRFRNKTELIDVDGVQWDMRVNKWYDSGRITNNSPFISLIENTKEQYLSTQPGFGEIKGIKTAMYCSHTKMISHFPSDKILKPLFVQCIHNDNISNKIVGDELPAKDARYWKSKY